MTKAQEIALFRRMIRKFGPDSYIGPWLQSVEADVVMAIRADLSPGVYIFNQIDTGNRPIPE